MQEEEFDILWANLVERSFQPDSIPLSECERNFYAVNLLRGSVPRSGFVGFFENFSGQEILDAHAGLKALGLETVLALLEKAEATALRDKPLLPSASPMELIPSSLSEDEYEQEMDRLDEALGPVTQEFYAQDGSIWDALCRYADENDLKPRS
ncbi:DMP19 family protein [Bremerella sp. T1]|uniref:DMP19 family protein n=1 Tax=Bremerella sp. TYQ1 TaxID=3119568 RepID=UPI001CCC0E36|nr:DUF4375 domain-containing protein [Bremerella volcania]UBM36640.1 DMP19 family protein [Bremerella volcania]